MNTLKIKIIGSNKLFPEFELGQEYEVSIDIISEGAPTHSFDYEGTEYLFEIKKTFFRESNRVVFEGILVDDSREKRVGKIAFKVNLNN